MALLAVRPDSEHLFLGGFDTHAVQIAAQQVLFSQLSPTINAFYSATVELGLAQQETTFTMGGPDDSGSNGRRIPTTSFGQYGATFAARFGVQASDLHVIFPNLSNFAAFKLGFLG